MQTIDLNQSADVHIGFDMERLSPLRETRSFGTLAQDVAWAMQEMPRDRRYGAFIRTPNGDLDWPQIEDIARSLT